MVTFEDGKFVTVQKAKKEGEKSTKVDKLYKLETDHFLFFSQPGRWLALMRWCTQSQWMGQMLFVFRSLRGNKNIEKII